MNLGMSVQLQKHLFPYGVGNYVHSALVEHKSHESVAFYPYSGLSPCGRSHPSLFSLAFFFSSLSAGDLGILDIFFPTKLGACPS